VTLWQEDSIFLAALMAAIAVIGFVRSRRLGYFVLLLQVLALFEVGLVVYAIHPGPEPTLTPLVVLAGVLLVLGVVVAAWTLGVRRKLVSAGPITVAQLDALNGRSMASRLLMFLFLTTLLFDFEPWIGVSNVVLNVVWACLWIPAGLRRYALGTSTEIHAPPSAVFAYLVDPGRWNEYRAGNRKIINVSPPGPLAPGSEIVSRQAAVAPKSLKPLFVDSTTRVTEIVPDRKLETVWRDRPSEHSRTVLEPVPGGTRISTEVTGLLPYRDALAGVGFDIGTVLALRKVEFEANALRLKQILEGVPDR